jgi:hypothetical protein
MLPTQAEQELITRLTAAGLSPEALDPREAWKVFKQYLHTEVQGVYDAASFQCGPFPDDGGEGESFYAKFVRQFSRLERKEEAPVRQIVMELCYGPDQIQLSVPAELWTHDFPTLENFASVVEGLPQFQAAMSAAPKHSKVYGKEL